MFLEFPFGTIISNPVKAWNFFKIYEIMVMYVLITY